jgi:hypothetical protein
MSSNNVGHLITKNITTLQHFTTLHSTTLHYTYRHLTSPHLHFTTPSFGLTHLHFLPLCFTSRHWTRHSTALVSKSKSVLDSVGICNSLQWLLIFIKHWLEGNCCDVISILLWIRHTFFFSLHFYWHCALQLLVCHMTLNSISAGTLEVWRQQNKLIAIMLFMYPLISYLWIRV